MPFKTGDQVVLHARGVGHIVGLVTKRFLEAEERLYYEVAIKTDTVWVPVDAGATSRLRSLTPKHELAHYRSVLKSRPALMTQDSRQRHQDLVSRLRTGSFQDLCEIVRDITAQRWRKALGEADAAALRKAREGLCEEWAAVNGVSALQAAEEVDALLLEGRQAYGV